MIDIKEGDVLVIGADEYPIRAIEKWIGMGNTASFNRTATVSASTKRAGAVASGLRGAPTTNLASLKITPLDPVDAELRQRLTLKTPNQVYQTFAADSTSFVRMVVEDLKR
jgi:hypothetical protein